MTRIRPFGLVVLALAVSYCGGGGGGSSPSEPPPPPGGSGQVVVVQVTDFNYSPRSIMINPGDTVRWVFAGPSTNHTVTARDGSWDSGAVFTGQGASFSRRFDTAGTYEYSCQAHSVCCLMRGSIRVGDGLPPPDPTYE